MEVSNNKLDEYQNKIQKLCDELMTIKDKLHVLSSITNEIEEINPKYFVCVNIIDKLCALNKRVSGNDELLSLVSSLRYTLEVLITTKLFIQEPQYIYNVYYCIYLQQQNKLNYLIKRAKDECNFLEELEKEEQSLVESTISEDEVAASSISKVFSLMNKKSKERITFFLDGVEMNGFGFQKYLIESQVIPKFESQLSEVEKLTTEKSKELSKLKFMNDLFDIRRQPTKVFKEFSDKRSWAEKAEEVGLKYEYELMYELTSSLMHCTSYSLFTGKFLEDEELIMMYKQMTQYLEKVVENLSIIFNLDKIECFIIRE